MWLTRWLVGHRSGLLGKSAELAKSNAEALGTVLLRSESTFTIVRAVVVSANCARFFFT